MFARDAVSAQARPAFMIQACRGDGKTVDPAHAYFFSSRRRHTICLSDWSSDVCSSDLVIMFTYAPPAENGCSASWYSFDHALIEIGRASCRERVEKSAEAEWVKKKTNSANDYPHPNDISRYDRTGLFRD